MNIHISGNHIQISAPLKKHVEEKMQKISTLYKNIVTVEILLKKENDLECSAEANIKLPKAHLNATASHEDLYAAIDLLADKCVTLVKKYKEKHHDHGDGKLI